MLINHTTKRYSFSIIFLNIIENFVFNFSILLYNNEKGETKMERKGQLIEIIIKSVYFIFSIIAAVFIVKNIISMIPLYRSFQFSEQEMYNFILKTPFGIIYKDIGNVELIDSSIVSRAIVAFIKNIHWGGIIFLIITLIMLFTYFMFIKWQLVGTYLKLSSYLILAHLAKYILFALSILIFFKDDMASFSLSMIIGTSLYLILSLVELFILSLFIIKFILNIANDIKTFYCH